jgi:hypothetical protein
LYPAIPHDHFPGNGIECDICKGTGIFPDYYDYLPEKGKAMKDDRINRMVHLRDEVLRTGIDARTLSRMEKGYFKKEPT